MRTVIFNFTNGKVNGKVSETVQVEDDTTDKELDEMLSDWLWATSNAHWVEEQQDD